MSKMVTKDRQRSLAVHMNRGIMRFSFVSMGPLRAFVSDVDTIGSFPSRASRPSGPREGRGVGRRPSRPGTFDIDGCSPRVRGQDGCPRTRGLHPSMSNVPGREGLLPTPRPSEGPLDQCIHGGNKRDHVHIGYKGSERPHTDERKPHDSAVHMDGRGALAVLCHRFGHSGPRSPPVALSVRAAELDEEHPGHDERDAGHHSAGQRLTEEEP